VTRITVLLLACLLPACAFRGLSLPRGVYLQNCSYGVLAQSQPARCLTRTEYLAEKEKARHAGEDAARDDGRPTDPRYKDWIPGTSADSPSDTRTPTDREKGP
jgi:hypothetical protein